MKGWFICFGFIGLLAVIHYGFDKPIYKFDSFNYTNGEKQEMNWSVIPACKHKGMTGGYAIGPDLYSDNYKEYPCRECVKVHVNTVYTKARWFKMELFELETGLHGEGSPEEFQTFVLDVTFVGNYTEGMKCQKLVATYGDYPSDLLTYQPIETTPAMFGRDPVHKKIIYY
jgi:hypothetical protein